MNATAEYKLLPQRANPTSNQLQYKLGYLWNKSKASEASFTLPPHSNVYYFSQVKRIQNFPLRFNMSFYNLLNNYRTRTGKSKDELIINWVGGWSYDPNKGVNHIEILKAYKKTSPSFKEGIQDMVAYARKGFCCLEVSGYASMQWKLKQHDSSKEGKNYNKELAMTRMIQGAKFLSSHFGLSYDYVTTGEFKVSNIGTELPNFNANQSIMIRSIWL